MKKEVVLKLSKNQIFLVILNRIIIKFMEVIDFAMEFNKNIKIWDSESDFIITNSSPLLNEKNCISSPSYFRWAYSINTAKGLFYRSEYKQVTVTEKISNDVSFTFPETLPFNLLLDNGNEIIVIMKDVIVWGKYFDNFFVFSSCVSGSTYIIDSRGEIFLLPNIIYKEKFGNGKKIECNRKKGFYLIDNTKIYFRNKEQRKEFEYKSQPLENAQFNKEFNKFVKANSNNEQAYLYLSAGGSKCGTLISYFSSKGMKYEVVPNLLKDDDTLNVRVPLNDDNYCREDVQFLCQKYSDNYSIYGVSYKEIGGGLDFDEKHRKIKFDCGFYLPKNKETIVYSILETFKVICGTDSDYEIYKKTLSKINRLLNKANYKPKVNVFGNLLLKHPNDIHMNERYILEHLDYINQLLKSCFSNNFFIKEDFVYDNNTNDLPYSTSRVDLDLYRIAYQASKNAYKEKMERFESDVLAEMTSLGYKINKWKSEVELFSIVCKEFKDAIYQYHCDWLGLQSLDIYIPSLKLAIEYQGEQHYRPIELFGGEKGFYNTIKRDLKKKQLCKKNNIKLIYWKYDEVISKNKLLQKLKSI